MMAQKCLKISLYTALVVVFGMVSTVSIAANTALHQIVDDLAIYFGVLPAEMIRGHPQAHHESQMHGGIPTDQRVHLTVAIFDSASGTRVTGAKIKAKVIGNSGIGPQKILETMTVAGKSSYGNYFIMPGAGPYRIELQIRRPGTPRLTRATFTWGRS